MSTSCQKVGHQKKVMKRNRECQTGRKKTTELRKCPYCGGKPDTQRITRGYEITCFRFGCIKVSAPTLADAQEIWNNKNINGR